MSKNIKDLHAEMDQVLDTLIAQVDKENARMAAIAKRIRVSRVISYGKNRARAQVVVSANGRNYTRHLRLETTKEGEKVWQGRSLNGTGIVGFRMSGE